MPSDRPNWYYDHPPTCTCVNCTDMRLKRNRTGGWIASIKRVVSRLIGKNK